MSSEVLNPHSLILPSGTTAAITALAATAEKGSLFFDSTANKLIFVTNAGGHEHVTSA